MCLAVPGLLTQTEGEGMTRVGRVNFEGVIKTVNLAYLPDSQPGDYVVVHAGFAISRVDAEAAKQALAYFQQIGEMGELAESPAEKK